jgi:branched-chain amino acid transport system ATP-binding protein
MIMILSVSNLTVGYYKDIDVLTDISLQVKEKSIVCIIGPNGAGKSTLLKSIYGFLTPKKGDVIYNEESIVGVPPHSLIRKGLYYVPQENSTFPQLTVEENIKMSMWTFRNDKEKVQGKLYDVYCEFPNLAKKRHMKATFLSGGELKMLELAKALSVEPKLLLIDEPTAGLAPIVQNQIYLKITEMRKKGMSILLVDQNIEKGIDVSDYVYMIQLGRNYLEGSRDFFKKSLKEIVSKSLIG